MWSLSDKTQWPAEKNVFIRCSTKVYFLLLYNVLYVLYFGVQNLGDLFIDEGEILKLITLSGLSENTLTDTPKDYFLNQTRTLIFISPSLGNLTL